jgi:drug/metabolite transporter (DMT)-like permease
VHTLSGLFAIFMWGGLALLGNGTKAIPPFLLLSICFLIAAMLMFIKRIISQQALFRAPTLTLAQWFVGVFGLFGFHFCYFMALKLAPAIEVSLIAYLWPMILAVLLAAKGTGLKAIAGGLLGFVGVAFIVSPDVGMSFSHAHIDGYMLALACAFIWSGYSWFFSRSDNNVDDIGWMSVAVALFSFASHILFEQPYSLGILNEWLGIMLLGLGPVGGAFYLWDLGLKHGNKKLLASLSFAAPLISSVLLSLAGYNSWSTNIIIALGFILLGAAITNFPSNKRTMPQL